MGMQNYMLRYAGEWRGLLADVVYERALPLQGNHGILTATCPRLLTVLEHSPS
jgi:hypothetical protein